MKKLSLIPVAVAAVLAAAPVGTVALLGFGASTLPAFADTLALNITGSNGTSQSIGTAQTYGWEFTTTTAFNVTQLGAWDDGSLTQSTFVSLLQAGTVTVLWKPRAARFLRVPL